MAELSMREHARIHSWVRRNWGSASMCEICGKTGLVRNQAHWANKDHEYRLVREDWFQACPTCHVAYDSRNNQKFVNTHCRRGHALTDDNVYVYPSRSRAGYVVKQCKQCAKERYKERNSFM